MGYLGSDPDKQFPQVLLTVPLTHRLGLSYDRVVLFGDDTGAILSIESQKQ